MIATTLFLGIIGIGLTFLPAEVFNYLDLETNPAVILILQILGAAYLGFAMLNWMAKNYLIGGIYSKPLVLGNFLPFLVSAFALIKIMDSIKNHFGMMLTLTIIYSVLALCFGFLSRTNPKKIQNKL